MTPLLLVLFVYVSVVASDVMINSANDFSLFVSSVNGGRNYSGETVYLGADIVLSEPFEPIGPNDINIFTQGTFDGQGHTISGLSVNATSYAGMFGYSLGLTIRNLVLDSTCSVKSTSIFTGGFIGICFSEISQCRIENSVNMANVTYNGNAGVGTLLLGGFAGFVSTYEAFGAYIKNCVNYGTVTDSGSKGGSNIGGIVGILETSYDNKYVQNCLNYGTIVHRGTITNELNIGGIVGFGKHAQIENCLNSGEISLLTSGSTNHCGNIVGKIEEAVSTNYCFWTSNTNCENLCGDGDPTSMTGSSSSSTDTASAVESLNAHSSSLPNERWNGWILNTNNKNVTFMVNGNKYIHLASQVILLPNLVSGGSIVFGGWFNDSECTKPFQLSKVTEDMTLYTKWSSNTCTVTLDPNGGIVATTTIGTIYGGAYGELPTPERTGYTFAGWFDDNNENITSESIVRTSNDHTLHAQWLPNTYIVTLDPNGGIVATTTTIGAIYGGAYGELPTPERTGYTFIGWFNERNENITSESIVRTSNDHTLHAQWLPNTYIVTLDPNGGIVAPTTKNVAFERAYGVLPTPEKTGYTFIGWFNERNENITSESIVRTSNDHTLRANWTELSSQIEIVFGTKDLTEEKVHKIIEAYTDEEFTILKVEDGKDGETKVVIKFTDPQKASTFLNSVKKSSESVSALIKRIDFVTIDTDSLSTMRCPVFDIHYFML